MLNIWSILLNINIMIKYNEFNRQYFDPVAVVAETET